MNRHETNVPSTLLRAYSRSRVVGCVGCIFKVARCRPQTSRRHWMETTVVMNALRERTLFTGM